MGVISSVIIVAIVLGSALIAVNNINPIIQEGRQMQSFSEAKKTLESLNGEISQLFFEAPGARRSVDVNLKNGKFIVSGGSDRLKIRLDDLNLFAPGVRRQEGNVLVTSGAQVDAYEDDVDNDGNRDLVIENDALLLAVRKVGTPSSHAIVNTTNMIVMIQNKNLNLNIANPKSGILINDTSESAYGIGYTELADRSNNIASASIHVFVNATQANLTYDAVFTLGPAQDFFEFYVAHVS